MDEADIKWLQKLSDHARDTRTFLSNKMKPETERAVCRAFLRTIGVSFGESEIIVPSIEPADVSFRTARFQVRLLLDPDRKLGDEWKKREQKYRNTKSLDELLVPCPSPIPLGFEHLVPKLVIALSDKAQKYGNQCTNIDALVYVDLKERYLATESRILNLEGLKLQKWRSVSVLFSPFGVVLFTGLAAPEFLKAIAPGPHMEWKNIDTLFKVRN